MSLCFNINSRWYTPSFMASLLMETQIGGMDLRPRDKATERPVRYMFRSHGFPWISSEITRTNFFDLPIWDSNSSSFSCRSFSSQREPTVVGSIKYIGPGTNGFSKQPNSTSLTQTTNRSNRCISRNPVILPNTMSRIWAPRVLRWSTSTSTSK